MKSTRRRSRETLHTNPNSRAFGGENGFKLQEAGAVGTGGTGDYAWAVPFLGLRETYVSAAVQINQPRIVCAVSHSDTRCRFGQYNPPESPQPPPDIPPFVRLQYGRKVAYVAWATTVFVSVHVVRRRR